MSDVAAPDVITDSPAGQLLVQRGLFGCPVATVNPRMYSKLVRGKADFSRFAVSLRAGAEVDTDTYFGRFAASYWQQATSARTVRVSLAYTTTGRLRVDIVAGDTSGRGRTVATDTVVGSGELQLEATLDDFLDGGALWLRFSVAGGDADVSRVRWSVPHSGIRAPVAIGICTFNRPDDCVRTVGALAADLDAIAQVGLVLVVDQGSAAVADHPQFTELSERLGGRLVYLRQPNLGGAGGFTRKIGRAHV